MNGVLPLGPLTVPIATLLTLGACLLGLMVGDHLGRRTQPDVRPHTMLILLVTFATARLAFVWQDRDGYAAHPWSVMDLRDGGWQPTAGLAAAWICTLWLLYRRPSLRSSLLGAVGTATALWLVGTFVLTTLDRTTARLPDLSVLMLDGRAATLAVTDGRPVVINLWASWCPPCQREMPVLAKAQGEHPELRFVFLDQGETPAAVQDYIAHRGLDLHEVMIDPQARASRQFSQGALPTTLFLDGQGKVVDMRLGEVSPGSLSQHLARLEALPAPGKPARTTIGARSKATFD